MRSSHLVKGILLFCLLLASTLAQAVPFSPCAQELIGSLVGTTCTIGDKTFEFHSAFAGGVGSTLFPVFQFEFTPDASNPLAPSFMITRGEGLTLDTPGVIAEYELFFTVSTTSGSATLAGVDVTLDGSASGGGAIEAVNQEIGGSGITPPPQVCIGVSSFPCAPAPASAAGTFVGGPISSENGITDWDLNTLNGGTATATFLSATYSFDQVTQTQVPEPGTLLLLGSSLSLLALRRRPRELKSVGFDL